jgi:hypothetical protein
MINQAERGLRYSPNPTGTGFLMVDVHLIVKNPEDNTSTKSVKSKWTASKCDLPP